MDNFQYFILNKPFGMLSQFTREAGHLCLGDLDFKFPKDVYSMGRLDHDSEGLLLLTNDNYLKTKTLDPDNHYKKEYWVQVEGEFDVSGIESLQKGISINIKGKIHNTKPAEVKLLNETKIWERNPPIRQRLHIPTSWVSIKITEGKNRQIRKMTAHVGFPTLRLIRMGFGNYQLDRLLPGQVLEISKREIYQIMNLK